VKRTGSENKPSWTSTPIAYLVRRQPSEIYFARVRIGGKLIWRTLKTKALTVARLRLPDTLKELRAYQETRRRFDTGKVTIADALIIYEERLEGNPALKEGAKIYRRKCIASLKKTWPELLNTEVGRITRDDCLGWGARLAKEYSPSVYNNTVATLRHVLDIAIERGALFSNPANRIPKRKPTQKHLDLPSREQFQEVLKRIEMGHGWCSRECADLVRFLAFGGFRKGEAAHVTWADCDFKKGEIVVRGDPQTGTKNSTIRRVPMIPDMRALVERLRNDRPEDPPTTRVMKVQECQKALDRSTKAVGVKRMTHHDLRHFFATRCIESGVDVPTVSRWLGHKDGGALAMRVYGHLRDQHSAEMAKQVTF